MDGNTFTIENKKLQSWTAFDLLRKFQAKETQDYDRVAALVQLVEYITGTTEKELVGLCGGEDASLVEVVTFAQKIITAAYPKN